MDGGALRRPRHAVGLQAMRALPALERLLGGGAEDPVGGEAEGALKSAHAAAVTNVARGHHTREPLWPRVAGWLLRRLRALEHRARAQGGGGARLRAEHPPGPQALGLLPALQRPLRERAANAVRPPA